MKKQKNNNMTVEDYMKLNYTIMVQEMNDSSGHYFFGKVLELDGCMSDGETMDELQVNIREAMECYIEAHIKFGDPVPVPVEDSDYSGKFNLRIPKSLHQRLTIEAKKEGVSLNQYAVYKLSM